MQPVPCNAWLDRAPDSGSAAARRAERLTSMADEQAERLQNWCGLSTVLHLMASSDLQACQSRRRPKYTSARSRLNLHRAGACRQDMLSSLGSRIR